MQCPDSADLLEDGQYVSFASAEQFFSNLRMFRKTMVCCTIPASIEEIGDGCFSGCSSLSRVTFASGSAVRRIGKEAFRECRKLSEIEIPASVEDIGEACFSGCFSECANLASVTFLPGSSLKGIEKEAFEECKNLREMEIPAGVESLGDLCFSGCAGLRTINIPDSVESLGYCCFYECAGLQTINIPDSVKSLGESCFYGCAGLHTINIPNSVKSLGDCCFWGCAGLRNVSVPAHTKRGRCCFDKCHPQLQISKRL